MSLFRRKRENKVVCFVGENGKGYFHVVYGNGLIGPVSQGYQPDKRAKTEAARRTSALRAAKRAAKRDHPTKEILP